MPSIATTVPTSHIMDLFCIAVNCSDWKTKPYLKISTEIKL